MRREKDELLGKNSYIKRCKNIEGLKALGKIMQASAARDKQVWYNVCARILVVRVAEI
jgi:hypothetical protein